MTSQPYLSIVATTRNDDHGGGLLRRTQTFLDALAAQCERHGLDAELVLVEWNPPPDRPGLRDALRWPAPGDHFEARIVEVPAAIHARLAHSDGLPLFQMIAKNVGIRRAHGAFVLATNIDLIFSDELIRFLAERKLDPGVLYRVDRYDVEAGVPDAPIDELLEWCERHVIRINRREGTEELSTGRFYRIYEHTGLPLWLASCLRLTRYVGHGVWHWTRLALRAPRRVFRPDASTRATVSAESPLPRTPLLEAVRRGVALSLRDVRHAWLSEPAQMRLHGNASGDFTLLSREGWFETGGYPELELYSFFIDSLFMYEAHYAGFHEVMLPYRLYHIEHGAGFKPDDEGVEELNTRLERQGVPQISYDQFLEWVIQMYRTRRSVFQARPTWGLSDEPLREKMAVERGGFGSADAPPHERRAVR